MVQSEAFTVRGYGTPDSSTPGRPRSCIGQIGVHTIEA